MINLNDASFDAKEVSIFNNGEAGIVENVTLDRIEPKQDPNSNQPDFKLFFKDTNGKELSFGLYAVTDMTREYATDQLKKQGALLKHFAHTFIDPSYQFQPFKDGAEMLSSVLLAIRSSINTSVKYRMYTNYGTVRKPSSFISMRGWVPCVEPMTVALENTRLEKSTIEILTRVTPDATSGSTTVASPVVDADW